MRPRILAPVPSGQGRAETYGPPEAHVPVRTRWYSAHVISRRAARDTGIPRTESDQYLITADTSPRPRGCARGEDPPAAPPRRRTACPAAARRGPGHRLPTACA